MVWREWTIGNRIAVIALIGTAGAAGYSVAEARHIQPAPTPAALRDAPNISRAKAGSDGNATARAAVLRAVARDPFRPDRKRPPDRYRLPSERRLARERERRRQYRPSVLVYGTAARPGGGGVAAIEWAGRAPRTVTIGDTIAEWTLVRIEDGRVMLAGRDTVLTFYVQRPVHVAGRQQ